MPDSVAKIIEDKALAVTEEFDFSLDFSMDFESAAAELKIDEPIIFGDPNIEWRRPGKGRPRAVIYKNRFEFFVAEGFNQAQIIKLLGVTDKTLLKWIKDKYNGKGFIEAKKEIIAKWNERLEKHNEYYS